MKKGDKKSFPTNYEYSDSETITAETSDCDGEIKKFKKIMK